MMNDKERIKNLKIDNARLNALFDCVKIPNGKFLASSRFQTATDLLTAYEALEAERDKLHRVCERLKSAVRADMMTGHFWASRSVRRVMDETEEALSHD